MKKNELMSMDIRNVTHLKFLTNLVITEEVLIFDTIHQSRGWVGTCYFRITELLKTPMVVSSKFFARVDD